MRVCTTIGFLFLPLIIGCASEPSEDPVPLQHVWTPASPAPDQLEKNCSEIDQYLWGRDGDGDGFAGPRYSEGVSNYICLPDHGRRIKYIKIHTASEIGADKDDDNVNVH